MLAPCGYLLLVQPLVFDLHVQRQTLFDITHQPAILWRPSCICILSPWLVPIFLQSFLSSQNDGEEVVWRTSPLAPLPAGGASGGGPDPRASSAYARGGPAGFSGRCSPLPAVKNMLSTASMLKQCGKTTSPPDAKVSWVLKAPKADPRTS